MKKSCPVCKREIEWKAVKGFVERADASTSGFGEIEIPQHHLCSCGRRCSGSGFGDDVPRFPVCTHPNLHRGPGPSE